MAQLANGLDSDVFGALTDEGVPNVEVVTALAQNLSQVVDI